MAGISLTPIFLFFVTSSNVYIHANEYRLPIKFFIIRLPFEDNYSFWLINFLYQFMLLSVGATFFYVYFAFPIIFMNHSCWGADNLILEIKRLDPRVENEKGPKELRQVIVAKRIKQILEMSYSLLDWQETVQRVMQYNFLVEFTLLSFLFCMCIYTMTSNGFESIFVLFTMQSVFCQLFMYCWMGSRVKNRFDQLSDAIYDAKWFDMAPKQRKDLKMILMMSQNIIGFNGIFNSVSLETFQHVNIIKDSF